MKSIQDSGVPGQGMTTGEAAEEISRLCDAWANAEAAYEAFLGEYEQIDVLMMSDADFAFWRAWYARLYSALWEAQLAYYQAVRGAA